MFAPKFQPIVPTVHTPEIFPGAWRREPSLDEERALLSRLRDVFTALPVPDSELTKNERAQRDVLLDWFSGIYPWQSNGLYCFVDTTLRMPDNCIIVSSTFLPFEQKSRVYTVPNLGKHLHPNLERYFDPERYEQFFDPVRVVLWHDRTSDGTLHPRAAAQFSQLASAHSMGHIDGVSHNFDSHIHGYVSKDGEYAPRPIYSVAFCALLEEMFAKQQQKAEAFGLPELSHQFPQILATLDEKQAFELYFQVTVNSRHFRGSDKYLAVKDDLGAPRFTLFQSELLDPDRLLGKGEKIVVSPYNNLRLPPLPEPRTE